MSRHSSTHLIRTILFATDFSAASEEAFRVACSVAEKHRAGLIIAHVASPEVPGLGTTDSLVLHDDYLGAVEARLRALQGRAPHVPMQFRIEQGHPSIEIVKLALAAHADLIVIGTQRGDAPPLPPARRKKSECWRPARCRS
jgi:nucleotide-binding universal stress UspA family protein